MRLPLKIQFHNLEPSPAVEQAATWQAEKLEQFHDEIVSCRVTIESPHKHHHKGKLYRVVVDVRVPGDEIVVSRSSDDEQAHEDVYVAMRDAFRAAERQLKKRSGKRRDRSRGQQADRRPV